jgi:hypothetical protein
MKAGEFLRRVKKLARKKNLPCRLKFTMGREATARCFSETVGRL